MNQQIVEKVNAVLAEGFELEPDKLTAEATLFDDLGLDSLDAVDMLVYLEENFNIKLDGEVFKDVRTLGDIYAMVAKLELDPSKLDS